MNKPAKPKTGWFETRFEDRPNRIRLDCITCSRPMFFPKSKAGIYKTCGAACNADWHESVREKRAKNCQTCGEKFIPRPRQLAQGIGNYCSQKCNTKSHQQMNTVAAQAKARESWMKTFLSGSMRVRKGPDNNRWNGGKEAARKRQRDYLKRYQKENVNKVRTWYANRQSRLKAAGKSPSWAVDFLLKAQKSLCVVCRKDLKKAKFHIDHVVPVSKGGTSELSNIQLLCAPCNLSKSAKDPIDFMQEKGFLL